MIGLIQIEIWKIFYQKKSWISFVVFALIIALIHISLFLEGQTLMDLILQNFKNQLFIEGNIINGYFISYITLNTLWIHVPVLLVIVTADVISGELNSGTIRIILSSPINRSRLLIAKTTAVFFYVLVFMLFMGLVTLIPSLLLFGNGDLLVIMDGLQVVLQKEALSRFILSFGFGTLSMFCFASVSILCSTLFRNTLTAILVSLGLLVISTLLQSFGLGIFDALHPYLFTYHMTQWQLFFVREIPTTEILKSAVFLLSASVVVLSVAMAKFTKTQITE